MWEILGYIAAGGAVLVVVGAVALLLAYADGMGR